MSKPEYEVFRRGYIFNYEEGENVPHWCWRLRVGRSQHALYEDGFYSKEEAMADCEYVMSFIYKAKRKIVVRKRALPDV